jgi:hypothetical protein
MCTTTDCMWCLCVRLIVPIPSLYRSQIQLTHHLHACSLFYTIHTLPYTHTSDDSDLLAREERRRKDELQRSECVCIQNVLSSVIGIVYTHSHSHTHSCTFISPTHTHTTLTHTNSPALYTHTHSFSGDTDSHFVLYTVAPAFLAAVLVLTAGMYSFLSTPGGGPGSVDKAGSRTVGNLTVHLKHEVGQCVYVCMCVCVCVCV